MRENLRSFVQILTIFLLAILGLVIGEEIQNDSQQVYHFSLCILYEMEEEPNTLPNLKRLLAQVPMAPQGPISPQVLGQAAELGWYLLQQGDSIIRKPRSLMDDPIGTIMEWVFNIIGFVMDAFGALFGGDKSES